MTNGWPLFDLEIRTPRVSMRLPNEAEILELAAVAAAGVHRPGEQPFLHPWTDGSAEDRARHVLQTHWRDLGRWTPEKWCLGLGVFVDDAPVGVVGLWASDFPIVREVATWSWLGLDHHRQGFGTDARAGLLTLAFDHLGAVSARTEAFQDSHASLGVSRKLGYEPDGVSRDRRGDESLVSKRLRLSRKRWQSQPDRQITITGFEQCRSLFGM